MINTKPCIYQYDDFRQFLRESYAHKHKNDRKFTKAFVCKMLGLPNSRSYFQDVLNGKYVSEQKSSLFAKLFELDDEETAFFKILVNLNQAPPEDREYYLEQMILHSQTPHELISIHEYAYYKEWYHSVIRAVLNITDFSLGDDYSWLARQVFPAITKSQAQSSVRVLLNLKLIKEDENGFLKPTKKVITSGSYAKDQIVKQYQQKALGIAQRALFENKEQSQRVITKMISVSAAGYERIIKHLERYNNEITSIVCNDEAEADRVYQLAIALYPLSKKVKK